MKHETQGKKPECQERLRCPSIQIAGVHPRAFCSVGVEFTDLPNGGHPRVRIGSTMTFRPPPFQPNTELRSVAPTRLHFSGFFLYIVCGSLSVCWCERQSMRSPALDSRGRLSRAIMGKEALSGD
jgi:hypothetical protein